MACFTGCLPLLVCGLKIPLTHMRAPPLHHPHKHRNARLVGDDSSPASLFGAQVMVSMPMKCPRATLRFSHVELQWVGQVGEAGVRQSRRVCTCTCSGCSTLPRHVLRLLPSGLQDGAVSGPLAHAWDGKGLVAEGLLNPPLLPEGCDDTRHPQRAFGGGLVLWAVHARGSGSGWRRVRTLPCTERLFLPFLLLQR
jgi:hypothetical protein